MDASSTSGAPPSSGPAPASVTSGSDEGTAAAAIGQAATLPTAGGEATKPPPTKDTTLSELGLEGSSSDESEAEDVKEPSAGATKPQASAAGIPGLSSDESDDSDMEGGPQKPAPAGDAAPQSKTDQVAALFGSDVDDDSDEEDASATASGAAPEGGEGKEPEQEVQVMDLGLPELPRPKSSAGVMISKLPNILGLKSVPFDETRHDQTAEQEEFKLTTNIMRWRFKRDRNGNLVTDAEGKPERETNTRLVKWSDGSLQLMVGEEVFDVVVQPLPHSYLFAHQKPEGGSTCLECHTAVPSRLVFRPTSLHSQAHRNLTLAVRNRNRRESKLKLHTLAVNPEKQKEMRAKTTEDLLKKERRRQRDYRGRGGPRMDAQYLEGGNYEGTVSLKALKSQTMRGERPSQSPASTLGDLSADSSVEDEDEDWEARRERQLMQAKMERQKKAQANKSDSDDDVEFGTSAKNPSGKQGGLSSDSDEEPLGTRRALSDDDDDSDTPAVNPKKKQRKIIDDSDSD